MWGERGQVYSIFIRLLLNSLENKMTTASQATNNQGHVKLYTSGEKNYRCGIF